MATKKLSQYEKEVRDAAKAKRKEMLNGLQQFIREARKSPSIALPYSINICHYTGSKDAMVGIAKGLGTCEKVYGDWSFTLKKKYSENVIYEAFCSRDVVCEKKQVGTRKLAAEPEKVIPAVPEHEEPIYEWECSSLLG
jgi:hypothetical protein